MATIRLRINFSFIEGCNDLCQFDTANYSDFELPSIIHYQAKETVTVIFFYYLPY